MRAIVFDFDGTLTYNSKNVWKALWQSFAETNDGSYYRQLFKKFLNKQISHQDWCDLTCQEFMKAGIDKNKVLEVASSIKLIGGAHEFFKKCYDNYISLNIVSGSVLNVIYEVLGPSLKYFDSITANSMKFDNNQKLCQIKGTKYDFEGKAKFIEDFVSVSNVKANEILFVGNSYNDEWVHLAGCKTLCINPDDTETTNFIKWNSTLENVTDLREILPYVGLSNATSATYSAKYS